MPDPQMHIVLTVESNLATLTPGQASEPLQVCSASVVCIPALQTTSVARTGAIALETKQAQEFLRIPAGRTKHTLNSGDEGSKEFNLAISVSMTSLSKLEATHRLARESMNRLGTVLELKNGLQRPKRPSEGRLLHLFWDLLLQHIETPHNQRLHRAPQVAIPLLCQAMVDCVDM